MLVVLRPTACLDATTIMDGADRLLASLELALWLPKIHRSPDLSDARCEPADERQKSCNGA